MNNTPFTFIDEDTVKKSLDIDSAFVAIEDSYRLFSSGKTTTPHTISMRVDNGMFFVFPSHLHGHRYFVSKMATFCPGNKEKGLPSIQPHIFIYDSSNGSLVAIISARYFAGIRTAITSAVGVKHLTNGKPEKIAIIGSGVQARSHAIVLSRLFPSITNISIFSRNSERRNACVSDVLDEINGIDVSSAESSDQAIEDADVIVCVTDSVKPVISAEKVKSGACILAVGSMGKDMQEVPDEIMEISRVVVDSLQQVDSYGEIFGPKSRGRSVPIVGEIGEFIIGKIDSSGQAVTTVFKHHGLPVTDAALAESIFTRILGDT